MKDILLKLLDYRYLTSEEASKLLTSIVNGQINEAQISAIITIFLMRSISVDEVMGFRAAMHAMHVPVDLDNANAIDIVGTGGDNKNTFNISTAACFVVAGAGYRVIKHGNYGSTSVSGASNVLEYLGVCFTNDNDRLRKSLEVSNMAFLHAPIFSPALKAVAHIRKNLGVRTFFNVLGPLINPADPPHQLLGVYNLAMARLYAYIYQTHKKQFAIVHSLDGYDEISLTGAFKIITNKGEQLLHPADLALSCVKPTDIMSGSTVKDAADIFVAVLNGTASSAQTEVVLINAAFAIRVLEPGKSLETCMQIAKASLTEKRAWQRFRRFVELNQ